MKDSPNWLCLLKGWLQVSRRRSHFCPTASARKSAAGGQQLGWRGHTGDCCPGTMPTSARHPVPLLSLQDQDQDTVTTGGLRAWERSGQGSTTGTTLYSKKDGCDPWSPALLVIPWSPCPLQASPPSLSALPWASFPSYQVIFTFFKHSDPAAVLIQLRVSRRHQRDTGHQGEVGLFERPRGTSHLDLEKGAAAVACVKAQGMGGSELPTSSRAQPCLSW